MAARYAPTDLIVYNEYINKLQECCEQPNDAGADELKEIIKQAKENNISSSLNIPYIRCTLKPLYTAAELDNSKCFTHLIDANANIYAQTQGTEYSIIYHAIKSKGVKCIKIIYDIIGIKCLTKIDNHGHNAAHIAVLENNTAALEWFHQNLSEENGRMLFMGRDDMDNLPHMHIHRLGGLNDAIELARHITESFESPMIKNTNKG